MQTASQQRERGMGVVLWVVVRSGGERSLHKTSNREPCLTSRNCTFHLQKRCAPGGSKTYSDHLSLFGSLVDIILRSCSIYFAFSPRFFRAVVVWRCQSAYQKALSLQQLGRARNRARKALRHTTRRKPNSSTSYMSV